MNESRANVLNSTTNGISKCTLSLP